MPQTPQPPGLMLGETKRVNEQPQCVGTEVQTR